MFSRSGSSRAPIFSSFCYKTNLKIGQKPLFFKGFLKDVDLKTIEKPLVFQRFLIEKSLKNHCFLKVFRKASRGRDWQMPLPGFEPGSSACERDE